MKPRHKTSRDSSIDLIIASGVLEYRIGNRYSIWLFLDIREEIRKITKQIPVFVSWREFFGGEQELKIFYASVCLFNFASSVVGIFIPLYLFEKGFSIALIILFFALSQLGRLIFLVPSAYLSSSLGAKKIISISLLATFRFLE